MILPYFKPTKLAIRNSIDPELRAFRLAGATIIFYEVERGYDRYVWDRDRKYDARWVVTYSPAETDNEPNPFWEESGYRLNAQEIMGRDRIYKDEWTVEVLGRLGVRLIME